MTTASLGLGKLAIPQNNIWFPGNCHIGLMIDAIDIQSCQKHLFDYVLSFPHLAPPVFLAPLRKQCLIVLQFQATKYSHHRLHRSQLLPAMSWSLHLADNSLLLGWHMHHLHSLKPRWVLYIFILSETIWRENEAKKLKLPTFQSRVIYNRLQIPVIDINSVHTHFDEDVKSMVTQWFPLK